MLSLITVLAVCVGCSMDDKAPTDSLATPVPLITEILFDVPGGTRGDANKDGTRDPAGDEFVEILNAGTAPLELEGFRIVDERGWLRLQARKNAKPASREDQAADAGKPRNTDEPIGTTEKDADHVENAIDFVFPKFSLAPGEVAVVFNGFGAAIPGPVGHSSQAPSGPNENFHNARVFSMRCTSKYQAFSNDVETVMLISPAGKAVSAVQWDLSQEHAARNKRRVDRAKQSPPAKDAPGRDGVPDRAKRDKEPLALPEGVKVEHAPDARGSVQRASKAEGFSEHDQSGDGSFSPGKF